MRVYYAVSLGFCSGIKSEKFAEKRKKKKRKRMCKDISFEYHNRMSCLHLMIPPHGVKCCHFLLLLHLSHFSYLPTIRNYWTSPSSPNGQAKGSCNCCLVIWDQMLYHMRVKNGGTAMRRKCRWHDLA